SQPALDPPSVRTRLDLAGIVLPTARRRELREPRTDARHRRGFHGDALVWLKADGAASTPSGLVRGPQPGPALDAQDRPVADLPGAEDQHAASAAAHLPLPASAHEHR